MRRGGLTVAAVAAIAALIGTFGVSALNAQPAVFKRTVLQRSDLPSTPGREVVQVRADFEPGAAAGKHSHPGEEIGYVLSGTLELRLEGKPPLVLKAGDHFFIPPGVVHDGRNIGKGSASVLTMFIIEKGKPISTPVK